MVEPAICIIMVVILNNFSLSRIVSLLLYLVLLLVTWGIPAAQLFPLSADDEPEVLSDLITGSVIRFLSEHVQIVTSHVFFISFLLNFFYFRLNTIRFMTYIVLCMSNVSSKMDVSGESTEWCHLLLRGLWGCESPWVVTLKGFSLPTNKVRQARGQGNLCLPTVSRF